MSNALISATELGMDCVQVFTKNQRQWNAKPLQKQEIESWLNELQHVGSRADRHVHIGEGTCGRSCFKAIVELPMIDLVPKILETPKEDSPSGKPMDLVNLSTLRRMAKAAKKRR
jgi:endonuclease IV